MEACRILVDKSRPGGCCPEGIPASAVQYLQREKLYGSPIPFRYGKSVRDNAGFAPEQSEADRPNGSTARKNCGKSIYKKYIQGKFDIEIAFLEGPITRIFQYGKSMMNTKENLLIHLMEATLNIISSLNKNV